MQRHNGKSHPNNIINILADDTSLKLKLKQQEVLGSRLCFKCMDMPGHEHSSCLSGSVQMTDKLYF
jgi:hypothetical protein